MPTGTRSWTTYSPSAGALGAWIVVVVAGFAALGMYENRPGDRADAPGRWPVEPGGEGFEAVAAATGVVTVDPPPAAARVVLFAHPRCPCTLASVEELARVAAQVPEGTLDVTVALFVPAGADPRFTQTELAAAARRIPGAHVVQDVDGRLARGFGARTSGHVVAYDRGGALRLQGGLTISRGHAGDNRSTAHLRRMAEGAPVALLNAPVYGCDLLGETAP